MNMKKSTTTTTSIEPLKPKPGYIIVNNQYQICPNNTYSNNNNCTNCYRGQISATGSSSINNCVCPNNIDPIAFESAKQSVNKYATNNCPCLQGYYGVGSCTQCPFVTLDNGSIQSYIRGSTITSGVESISNCGCPANTYGNGKVCYTCGTGYAAYPLSASVTDCRRCPTGTVPDNNTGECI